MNKLIAMHLQILERRMHKLANFDLCTAHFKMFLFVRKLIIGLLVLDDTGNLNDVMQFQLNYRSIIYIEMTIEAPI